MILVKLRTNRLISLLILAIFIYFWKGLSTHINSRQSFAAKSRQFVLISAVYSAKSRMYSDNKFVLLINAPVGGEIERATFVAKSTNGTDHFHQNFALFRAAPPNEFCKWTIYMAVFDSVALPTSLSLGYGATGVNVEIERQYLKKRVQVGTCFSPLFLTEHWQLVVLAIEIYRHYGIKLQVVYLMSAIESIYKILKVYNQKDVVQIEPWFSIELDGQKRVENVNLELDWRNQAAAHTDCLIKYGYAAEFLIVGDLDDILVPDHGTYYEEFIQNDFRRLKNSLAFLYTRFTVEIDSTRNPAKFSLFDALASAKVALYQPDDPKYVVNTSRAESLWIHKPYVAKPYTANKNVPSVKGRMFHFRKWHFLDDNGIIKTENENKNKRAVRAWTAIPLIETFINTKTAQRIGHGMSRTTPVQY
uniref:Glycosyltransferase family 92 protein n=1 Tax=Globodera rostochiensis TaxID=31243 RepID=A0A914H8C7_GLORO